MVELIFENPRTDARHVAGVFSFVQITYDSIRVGPDGDEIAYYRNGKWCYQHKDDRQWSDVIIAAKIYTNQ